MTYDILLGLPVLQHYGPDSLDPAHILYNQHVCANKMYKMQSCTNKIVGMLLMHKQDVDQQQVCTNKIVGMFPMHNQDANNKQICMLLV